MNTQEQLSEWLKAITEAENLIDQIQPFIGCDGPISQTITRLMDTYTQTVARAVGDTDGHIEWFWLENELGQRGHEAIVNGESRKVRTIEDLLWMLGVDA